MLNPTGTSYTVELPLGSYNECRKLLADISRLQTEYLAALTDEERIPILKSIIDIYAQMLNAFLVERL